MMELAPNLTVQLVSCTIGCVGFALLFHNRRQDLLSNGIGAFLTWAIYLAFYHYVPSGFFATGVTAAFVAAYSQLMARLNKAPATVFLSISIFPVVPGAHLYFMMFHIVMQETAEAVVEAKALLLGCLGITLGFFVIEILNKYLTLIIRHHLSHGKEPDLPYWFR